MKKTILSVGMLLAVLEATTVSKTFAVKVNGNSVKINRQGNARVELQKDNTLSVSPLAEEKTIKICGHKRTAEGDMTPLVPTSNSEGAREYSRNFEYDETKAEVAEAFPKNVLEFVKWNSSKKIATRYTVGIITNEFGETFLQFNTRVEFGYSVLVVENEETKTQVFFPKFGKEFSKFMENLVHQSEIAGLPTIFEYTPIADELAQLIIGLNLSEKQVLALSLIPGLNVLTLITGRGENAICKISKAQNTKELGLISAGTIMNTDGLEETGVSDSTNGALQGWTGLKNLYAPEALNVTVIEKIETAEV